MSQIQLLSSLTESEDPGWTGKVLWVSPRPYQGFRIQIHNYNIRKPLSIGVSEFARGRKSAIMAKSLGAQEIRSMPRPERKDREYRVYRLFESEKELLQGFNKATGKQRHEALLDLIPLIESVSVKRKPVRIGLPTETLEALQKRAEKEHVPQLRILLLAAQEYADRHVGHDTNATKLGGWGRKLRV